MSARDTDRTVSTPGRRAAGYRSHRAIVVSSPDRAAMGRTVVLDDAPVEIGRAAHAEGPLALADAELSRSHARLERERPLGVARAADLHRRFVQDDRAPYRRAIGRGHHDRAMAPVSGRATPGRRHGAVGVPRAHRRATLPSRPPRASCGRVSCVQPTHGCKTAARSAERSGSPFGQTPGTGSVDWKERVARAPLGPLTHHARLHPPAHTRRQGDGGLVLLTRPHDDSTSAPLRAPARRMQPEGGGCVRGRRRVHRRRRGAPLPRWRAPPHSVPRSRGVRNGGRRGPLRPLARRGRRSVRGGERLLDGLALVPRLSGGPLRRRRGLPGGLHGRGRSRELRAPHAPAAARVTTG